MISQSNIHPSGTNDDRALRHAARHADADRAFTAENADFEAKHWWSDWDD